MYVLFYASWCPFCQEFLPMFKKFAEDKTRKCRMVMADDRADLSAEYSIDIVPTVLVFEKGKVTRRLDGIQGKGLSESQLMEFAKGI